MNINGQNISSTAIQVTWGLVPTEEQNGVISGYNIMYKAKKDSGNAWKNITVSSRTRILNITGLEYYTMYNVKMAGINSVGIGVYSNITDIRTDAYGKIAVLAYPSILLWYLGMNGFGLDLLPLVLEKILVKDARSISVSASLFGAFSLLISFP